MVLTTVFFAVAFVLVVLGGLFAAIDAALGVLSRNDLVELAAEREDLAAYMEADQALDRVNHAACRNPFAVAAVVPMVIQCRRFWYAYRHQGDIRRGAQAHLVLAEAIAAGQGEPAVAASDALMDYLRAFAQEVIA